MYGYIYLIINKLNGKTYVGKKKFRKIIQQWNTDNYMGSGTHLHDAKEKYGIENFEKFLICYTESEEDACEKEKFWIAEYRRRGKAEYNIQDGGQGSPVSEETRCKLSEAHKGKTTWMKGKRHSEEAKRKNSEAHKGKLPWNKGKRGIYSEETLKKISEHSKGRIPPSQKGKHRYNNGINNIFAFECPEGWVKGWIRK